MFRYGLTVVIALASTMPAYAAAPTCDEQFAALQALVEKLPAPQKPASAAADQPPLQPLPIDAETTAFKDAAVSFAKKCSKHAEAGNVSYLLGRRMYDLNQFADAVRYFDDTIRLAPKSERAGTAMNLILDIHNLKQDYDALAKAIDKFSKNKNLMAREELKKTVVQLAPTVAFKQLTVRYDKATEAAAQAKVAKDYLAFAKKYPASDLVPKALANAAVTYKKANKMEDAKKAWQQLKEKYPDDDMVKANPGQFE